MKDIYLLDSISQKDFTHLMALRVLLADESSTIKKVFQLALQDFAVDVRPVNIGIDVAPVSRAFKPDIIFADVLLQKKNGYDVSAQLKQDPELSSIPIVLMWSGFMELDEDKFNASMADAKLEKPFDVNQLRQLVHQLVPKTQSNKLSQYLKFPKMPDFDEKAKELESQAPTPELPPSSPKEEFHQVPLPKMKGKDKYKVDISPNDDVHDIPVSYNLPSEKIDVEGLLSKEEEPEEFSVRTPQRPPPPPDDVAMDLSGNVETRVNISSSTLTAIRPEKERPPTATIPQMSTQDLEKIIREQSQEMIEAVIWKIVPDLATQIIERELNKLLKEREANP